MWQRLKNIIDERIVRHFRESRRPVEEIAAGTAIGLFWALTPLVGIQMTLVLVCWVAARPMNYRFSLPIAMAWVWMSNPFTMPLLYYWFYVAGYYSFVAFGVDLQAVSAENFKTTITSAIEMGGYDGLVKWLEYMFYELGWPMLVGGFVVAFPIAFGSYPVTIRLMNKFRARKARKLGMTLAEWEAKFVQHHEASHGLPGWLRRLLRIPDPPVELVPEAELGVSRPQAPGPVRPKSRKKITPGGRRTTRKKAAARRKKPAPRRTLRTDPG